MFKNIAIAFLIGYILINYSGKIIRFLSSMTNESEEDNNDVKVSYVPDDKTKKNRGTFNGGEYTDYEEVD